MSKEIITEEVDVKKIIEDLGKTEYSDSNESQGKLVQLLRGLAFSDDPLANQFMKEVDKATTEITKRVLNKNESIILDLANDYIVG